jgi:hypothetical protein
MDTSIISNSNTTTPVIATGTTRQPITTGELRELIDSVLYSALCGWTDDQIGEASTWIWREVTSTAFHAAAQLDFPEAHDDEDLCETHAAKQRERAERAAKLTRSEVLTRVRMAAMEEALSAAAFQNEMWAKRNAVQA